MVEYLKVFSRVGFFFVRGFGTGIYAMDMPEWTTAQRIARTASAFEERQTGHVPQSVTVVLSEYTLVIASPTPGGDQVRLKRCFQRTPFQGCRS